MSTVRAKYGNGVLTPMEPLDLEEGAEVMVSVQGAGAEAQEETPAPRQGLVAIVERARERQKDIPSEESASIPTDLAMNHKHYLYGYPKEAD